MTEGLPPDFPAPTLPIMRALAVVATNADQSRLTQALDAFFTRHWGPEAAATHKPEVLKETLEGLFGTDEAARSTFLPSTYPEHDHHAPIPLSLLSHDRYHKKNFFLKKIHPSPGTKTE